MNELSIDTILSTLVLVLLHLHTRSSVFHPFFHSLLPFSIFNYCECNQNAKLKEFMSVLNVLLVYIFQLGGESKSERWLCSVLRRSLHEILYVIVCREHKNVHNKSDCFLILSFNSFCSASFCWSPQYARYHGHLFVDNLQDRLKWIQNTHTTEKVQDFYIRKPFHQANSLLNLQAKQKENIFFSMKVSSELFPPTQNNRNTLYMCHRYILRVIHLPIATPELYGILESETTNLSDAIIFRQVDSFIELHCFLSRLLSSYFEWHSKAAATTKIQNFSVWMTGVFMFVSVCVMQWILNMFHRSVWRLNWRSPLRIRRTR